MKREMKRERDEEREMKKERDEETADQWEI